nr:MAG TPA: hypothetical protein [Caudoviricetes sp.]
MIVAYPETNQSFLYPNNIVGELFTTSVDYLFSWYRFRRRYL